MWSVDCPCGCPCNFFLFLCPLCLCSGFISPCRPNFCTASQTFEDVGVTNGKISPEQWQQLVKANPQMISYMTLPVLSQLTTKYPVKK